ncbi:hypothetical protein MTR67_049423 [Solanum verrucosum]|uniref:glutaminase n=1 Tax=Solanum verrucosum TaxID=315347 RepID=A0AAF0V3E7_SOLVR|nr:hypothetical protein MTR67_049423 [Solanum verrucosum]
MVVGVLALQGSFNEHIAVLKRLGVKGVEVRKPEQLLNVSSLIIPGGESTTMAKLAELHNLFPALREFVQMGKPVWGTCAGLIFLANRATGGHGFKPWKQPSAELQGKAANNRPLWSGPSLDPAQRGQKTGGQKLIGGLDCTVHRNFFGSQIQSFETELPIPQVVAEEGGPPSFRAVFIRAPAILDVGPDVEVLADIPLSAIETINSNPAIPKEEDSTESGKKVIVAVKQGNLLATAFHPELTADTRWHSYFLKMVPEIEEGTSDIVSTSTSNQSFGARSTIDFPIYQ